MSYPLARKEAVESVLGDVEFDDMSHYTLNPHIRPPSAPAAGSTNAMGSSLHPSPRKTILQGANRYGNSGLNSPTHGRKSVREVGGAGATSGPPPAPQLPTPAHSPLYHLRFPLTEVILQLRVRVGVHFQRKFSRFILITDIPRSIEEHPLGPAPIWPPEPIYFNNILDIYADRRRNNQPMHSEDVILDIYERDNKIMSIRSKGYALLHQMDDESEEEKAEYDAIKSSKQLFAEAQHEAELSFGDEMVFGGVSLQELI